MAERSRGSDVGRFVRDGPADVAAVVVTYNSAADIGPLLETLRHEAREVRLRVIVADNSPGSETLDVVRTHEDVLAVPSGGNLGYAAGVNTGLEHAGQAEAYLVLNPDLRVLPGAVRAMLDELRRVPDAGIVVPRILDGEGQPAESLYHEPTVLRAFGDAVLGPLPRPAWLTEWVRAASAYECAHAVAWATGAALLVSADAAAEVGEWDERFFLYSEETDYCRRMREAGYRVQFTPDAVVRHRLGGSGSSAQLDALLAVNRVRYMRKHAPRRAGLYRAAMTLGAALRAPRSASHRTCLTYLRDERRWDELPGATWYGRADGHPIASVVIPAYNESSVIARTLDPLAAAAATGVLDVHVVCNGCHDDTAAVARTYPGVRVSELEQGSKPAALNLGLERAATAPVLFLDADIELPSAAIPTLVRALRRSGTLATRPPFVYDTEGADWIVRAYYRAKSRIPELSSALWGACVYAVNEEGAARIGAFPDMTADDVYVDQCFAPHETVFPATQPVRVPGPLKAASLVNTLVRVRRGPAEQGVDTGRSTVRGLLRSVRGPGSLLDAIVYCACALQARRRRAGGDAVRWERDETRREPVPAA